MAALLAESWSEPISIDLNIENEPFQSTKQRCRCLSTARGHQTLLKCVPLLIHTEPKSSQQSGNASTQKKKSQFEKLRSAHVITRVPHPRFPSFEVLEIALTAYWSSRLISATPSNATLRCRRPLGISVDNKLVLYHMIDHGMFNEVIC